MKFSDFKVLMIELYTRGQEESAYLDSIPGDIQMAFVDNEYTNSIGAKNDLLIRALFTPLGLEEEVFFFLYEWQEGSTEPQIWIEDNPFVITTFDDYMDYCEEQYAWEDEL